MAKTARSEARIGFDIGGIFTDCILQDAASNSLQLHKLLTTPHAPSVAALQGLDEQVAMAAISLGDIGDLVHGTTLVTNAVIERKSAPLGLITTEGFRDILEMGFEQRYDICDLRLNFPAPLAPHDMRPEVAGRIDRDGGRGHASRSGRPQRRRPRGKRAAGPLLNRAHRQTRGGGGGMTPAPPTLCAAAHRRAPRLRAARLRPGPAVACARPPSAKEFH